MRMSAMLILTPTVLQFVTKNCASFLTASVLRMAQRFLGICVLRTTDVPESLRWSLSLLMTPSILETLTCMLRSSTNRGETPTDVTSKPRSSCPITTPITQQFRTCTDWVTKLLLTHHHCG